MQKKSTKRYAMQMSNDIKNLIYECISREKDIKRITKTKFNIKKN